MTFCMWPISESSVREHNAFVRGIHIGSAKTGEVTAFIPDPGNNPARGIRSAAPAGSEGVAVDKDGIIYATSVTPPVLAKYTLKKNCPALKRKFEPIPGLKDQLKRQRVK